MRGAGQILSRLIGKPPSVHGRRHQAVLWAVDAAVRGRRISVASLGRSARSRTSIKHQIKRADRLIGNVKLYEDHDAYFQAVARCVLGDAKRAVVLIDWTKVGAHWVLAAGVAHLGRSVPLLFEAWEEAWCADNDVHADFIDRLLRILPPGCRPILVTDAGFRGPWVMAATERGVDFVTRVPGYTTLRVDGTWETVDQLAKRAGRTPTDFGAVRMTKGRKLAVRAVLGPRYTPPKRKRRRRLRKTGARGRKVHVKSATQAWVLATSLDLPPEDVLRLYAFRMQIEEHFRDQKSHQFGLALRYARTTSTTRQANLLLIGLLVTLVLVIVGRIGQRNGLHRYFQANTITHRRVLSIPSLGRALLMRFPNGRATRRANEVEMNSLRRKLQRMEWE